MKKKKIFLIVLVSAIVFFGIDVVKASYYSMKVTSDVQVVKPGDIFEVDLSVTCVNPNLSLDEIITGIQFDKNVFQLYAPYGVRWDETVTILEGWDITQTSFQNVSGYANIYLKSTSRIYNITENLVSTNCGDNKNVVLLSGLRLQVLDVPNQTSTIWATADKNRSTSFEMRIFEPDANTNLKKLQVEGLSSNLNFNPNTLNYNANVPYNVDKIIINAECGGINCKVTNIGEKKLSVGENKFEITVTAENGAKKSYYVNITKEGPSNDATLSKLTVYDMNDENLIGDVFNSNKANYDIKVPYNFDKINIQAECGGINCKVSNTGEKKLNIGENKFEIIVTAESGTKKSYYVNIIKEGPSNDATLSKLIVEDSNGENLEIKFQKDKLKYELNVENEILFLNIDAECGGINCKVEKEKTKKLNVGKNEISIKVTSEDNTVQIYKIIVNRKQKDKTIVYLTCVIVVVILCIMLFLNKKNKCNKINSDAIMKSSDKVN